MRLPSIFSALLLTVPAPAAPADPLQRAADAVRALGVTGVQALVTSAGGGRRVVTSGVADVSTGAPMPPDGYVRIASVRKAFTATVVLQLVAERRLSLDDTVERRLPGVVPDGGRITVRMLLQNTSGIHDDLPGYTTPAEYLEQRYDVYTRDQLIARAMRHPLDFPPGTAWTYSNTGILLADAIVERVTGTTYARQVERRIVRPLGLAHTRFAGTAPGLPDPHARAYQLFEPGRLVDVTEQVPGDPDAVLATAADLDRFFRALLGGRLVPPAQLAEMQRTVDVSPDVARFWPGARYGLGLVSRPLSCGGVRWGHDGGDGGYITVTGTTPDGRRSATVTMSTALGDSLEHVVAQQRAADHLVDGALCPASSSVDTNVSGR